MFVDYQDFQSNLQAVNERIDSACASAGRPRESVKLLPVTKNHPAAAVRFAYQAGLFEVGENRVQEALGKREEVEEPVIWDLIGPLQSNKAKRAVEGFDRIQTVDRLKIANSINRFAGEIGKTMRVLMQVNAGADPNKAGVSIDEAAVLMESILAAENLKVEGLMTIAPLDDDPEVARRCFASLRECRDDLQDRFSVELLELSMGMSGDMDFAIEEGSTMIRVGTALYGARDYA
ncbi:MAG: YggS family pyridoxal phosphate-dependent enzyme [Verrucomicrobiota bacterium]